MKPAPFTWSSDSRATFTLDDVVYGIHADELDLNLPQRTITIMNISFGRQQGGELDTSLTGAQKPRTVFSTVAAACLENQVVLGANVIALAAADQVKSKRSVLYSIALAKLKLKHPKFAKANDITVHMPNGSIAVLLSKVKFTKDEETIIVDQLGITK